MTHGALPVALIDIHHSLLTRMPRYTKRGFFLYTLSLVHILSINLASHDGHIAVCSESQVLAWSDADHRMPDNELLPLLEKTLRDAHITYKDLTHIACVTGPGGFTSIRSGVTLSNVLSHELKIPLAGMHLSDVYFARRTVPTTWWLHSTKKDQLFVRGGSIAEPTLLSIDHALTHFESGGQWMGELIESQEELVQARGLTPADLLPLQEVLPQFLAAQSYASTLLEPWYGRGW